MAETVELATLDKEMAEEKVGDGVDPFSPTLRSRDIGARLCTRAVVH